VRYLLQETDRPIVHQFGRFAMTIRKTGGRKEKRGKARAKRFHAAVIEGGAFICCKNGLKRHRRLQTAA
jgi:hypothetical protein